MRQHSAHLPVVYARPRKDLNNPPTAVTAVGGIWSSLPMGVISYLFVDRRPRQTPFALLRRLENFNDAPSSHSFPNPVSRGIVLSVRDAVHDDHTSTTTRAWRAH